MELDNMISSSSSRKASWPKGTTSMLCGEAYIALNVIVINRILL